jgi:hypothetical protein
VVSFQTTLGKLPCCARRVPLRSSCDCKSQNPKASYFLSSNNSIGDVPRFRAASPTSILLYSISIFRKFNHKRRGIASLRSPSPASILLRLQKSKPWRVLLFCFMVLPQASLGSPLKQKRTKASLWSFCTRMYPTGWIYRTLLMISKQLGF